MAHERTSAILDLLNRSSANAFTTFAASYEGHIYVTLLAVAAAWTEPSYKVKLPHAENLASPRVAAKSRSCVNRMISQEFGNPKALA
jgi:hypothetical protein